MAKYSIVHTFVTPPPLFPTESPGKPRKSLEKLGFSFFPDFYSSKLEFTRLLRGFPGFSVGKVGCYKGTNNPVKTKLFSYK